MTEKLTKRIVDNAQYEGDGKSKHIIWDSTLTGLGLRVYPSGKKSFVLSYRQNGRKRLLTLGKYGVYTIDEARDLATNNLADINKGADPVEAKRQSAKAQTMEELYNIYLERYAKSHKKTWSEDERRINNHLLPMWKHHLIISITRNDIASLHNKIGVKHPYEANRTLALLSKMFELASEWGLIDETRANPASRIKKFKEEKRDRFVTQTEMPELIKAINNEKNIYAKYAIYMYLLTGMRKNEVLKLKWTDIDWDRKDIRLDDTKAGRVHYVPLTPMVEKLLSEIPKQTNNPHIFAGEKEGAHLVNIRKPWVRIRDEAKMSDVRLHDLRRTVGSWLAQSGHSLNLIGKVLNHSNESTTKIYAHLQESDARRAMEEHGKTLKSFIDHT